MRRRALAAVIVAAAVLGPAPRGESLTCMLAPLIQPRASSRVADQVIAHVRVVDRYPSRDSAGVIHARIVDVLAGKTARRVVRIDADWVLRWRMGLPDGRDGFPPGSEWIVALAPAAWGSRVDYTLPRCRALLTVTGEMASGHISTSERAESMTLAALQTALRQERPPG
jgi:hypothetical protein